MRDEEAYLRDMLKSARLASGYVAGKTFDEFMADTMLQDAVLWRLTIIGEAAKKIGPAARAILPSLPFDEIARMRDILAHVYWSIRFDLVWSTASRDLPVLIEAVSKHLGEPT